MVLEQIKPHKQDKSNEVSFARLLGAWSMLEARVAKKEVEASDTTHHLFWRLLIISYFGVCATSSNNNLYSDK
jgi:hypothetical protein